MKPARILPAATGILGLLLGLFLGLFLAPAVRKQGNEILPASAAGFPRSAKPSEPTPDDGKTNLRSRARERVEDKKPKEPRVSIPLKTVVETLSSKFSNYSDFNRIVGNSYWDESLNLLGATASEKEELKQLFNKSCMELFAAEKNLLKLGEVTESEIRIDMSGMRGPVEEITGRIKDGIRSILPADVAEALIAGIHWDKYYPTDEKLFIRLELTRSRNGKLTGWERLPSYSWGVPVPNELKDDGTPLPADRIFRDDRWKPILKGVTILPKDEE